MVRRYLVHSARADAIAPCVGGGTRQKVEKTAAALSALRSTAPILSTATVLSNIARPHLSLGRVCRKPVDAAVGRLRNRWNFQGPSHLIQQRLVTCHVVREAAKLLGTKRRAHGKAGSLDVPRLAGTHHIVGGRSAERVARAAALFPGLCCLPRPFSSRHALVMTQEI